MTRKPLVYVAGPISQGDTLANVAQAHAAGLALLRAGLAAIVPHGSCFWGHQPTACGLGLVPSAHVDGLTHADWVAMGLEVVRRCDAVVRLPGLSVGADLETAEARERGLPVFASVEEAVAHLKGTP